MLDKAEDKRLGFFLPYPQTKEFYGYLLELRLESGMTQLELAKKLRTTNRAVCDWEKGRTQPDLQMLKNIAALFSVSTDYLLGISDD